MDSEGTQRRRHKGLRQVIADREAPEPEEVGPGGERAAVGPCLASGALEGGDVAQVTGGHPLLYVVARGPGVALGVGFRGAAEHDLSPLELASGGDLEVVSDPERAGDGPVELREDRPNEDVPAESRVRIHGVHGLGDLVRIRHLDVEVGRQRVALAGPDSAPYLDRRGAAQIHYLGLVRGEAQAQLPREVPGAHRLGIESHLDPLVVDRADVQEL